MEAEMQKEETSTSTSSTSGEMLRLIHHHPGYIRAQAVPFVGAKEGESSVLAAARTAAESAPGFLKWSHNPSTGSIVVEYRSELLNPDDLLDQIVDSAGLDGVIEDIHSTDHRRRLVDGILDAVQEVNDIFYSASGGKADLRELLPATLLLNTVVAFILGEDRGRLPSWDSSLYKSYRIFMQFHKSEVKKREKREKKNRKKAA